MDTPNKSKNLKAEVNRVLTDYLEQNKLRKTQEREAILDAVYSIKGYFTIGELREKLADRNFHVSQSTLYNNLKLLIRLRLVIYQRTLKKTFYLASYPVKEHSHTICSVCGKITDIKTPGIEQVINDTALRRFHREGYALYIYGVCSSCQSKMTRRKKALEKTAQAKSDEKGKNDEKE